MPGSNLAKSVKLSVVCLAAYAAAAAWPAFPQTETQRQTDSPDSSGQSDQSYDPANSNSSNPSDSSGSSMEPAGETQPQEIPPGETNAAEPSAADSSPPLPEAPPAETPSGASSQESGEAAPSGQAPLPNEDSIPKTSGTFGPADIPGYVEAMNAAGNPSQAKGSKQLIESLREVFPINGNPLKDLFTPQPQFVTPQTLMNPQPKHPASGESNPLKGLFTPQPQYLTPQTLINPEPTPPSGEINHLKGVFTAQPQYPTPQTLMNPHALPRYYVKERLPDHFFEKTTKGKTADAQKGETQLGPAKTTDANTAGSNHPLRKAMLLINSNHEEDAIGLMDRLLVQMPGNYQAHYVRAVALVRLRRFADASEEYRTIMRFSPDLALRKLAQEGIARLSE